MLSDDYRSHIWTLFIGTKSGWYYGGGDESDGCEGGGGGGGGGGCGGGEDGGSHSDVSFVLLTMRFKCIGIEKVYISL